MCAWSKGEAGPRECFCYLNQLCSQIITEAQTIAIVQTTKQNKIMIIIIVIMILLLQRVTTIIKYCD